MGAVQIKVDKDGKPVAGTRKILGMISNARIMAGSKYTIMYVQVNQTVHLAVPMVHLYLYVTIYVCCIIYTPCQQ